VKTRPEPSPPEPLRLAKARVHEAEGAGRRVFALMQALRHPGPLVWVLPAHAPEHPLLPGLPEGVGARLHIVRARSETDLLWATEESLRAAPVGFVIAEPGKPLTLTAGRRLQLAAEAGGTTGLLLIREGAGCNAAETRWHCAPEPAETPDSTLHRWSLIKNKTGTLGDWTLHWDGTSAAFDLAQAAGERRGAAEPPR
jgi:protein ImuA